MLMKHFLYLMLIPIFLGSCHGEGNSEKEIISVSILPQKYLVEKIAGDLYHVNVLVPSGFSPETYEITPSQMKMLVRSRVFFIKGHLTFEDLWKRRSD